jgi:hypothetical protein
MVIGVAALAVPAARIRDPIAAARDMVVFICLFIFMIMFYLRSCEKGAKSMHILTANVEKGLGVNKFLHLFC